MAPSLIDLPRYSRIELEHPLSDISDAHRPSQAASEQEPSAPRTGPSMIGMRGISKLYGTDKPALVDVRSEERRVG